MPLVSKMATPTTEDMVSCAVSEERACNSCETRISHKISHGTTEPSIHLCLVQPQLPPLGALRTKFGASSIIVPTYATWLTDHMSGLRDVCAKFLVMFSSTGVSFWKHRNLLCSPCEYYAIWYQDVLSCRYYDHEINFSVMHRARHSIILKRKR